MRFMLAVLRAFSTATHYGKSNYRAWHAWAISNFTAAEFYNKLDRKNPDVDRALASHVVPAIQGFFRSISLGSSRLKAHILQVLCRLCYGLNVSLALI